MSRRHRVGTALPGFRLDHVVRAGHNWTSRNHEYWVRSCRCCSCHTHTHSTLIRDKAQRTHITTTTETATETTTGETLKKKCLRILFKLHNGFRYIPGVRVLHLYSFTMNNNSVWHSYIVIFYVILYLKRNIYCIELFEYRIYKLHGRRPFSPFASRFLFANNGVVWSIGITLVFPLLIFFLFHHHRTIVCTMCVWCGGGCESYTFNRKQ